MDFNKFCLFVLIPSIKLISKLRFPRAKSTSRQALRHGRGEASGQILQERAQEFSDSLHVIAAT